MIWLLEKAVRMNDQLDESLHAGFYFYILTSSSKFISNSVFIYPLVMMIAGFAVPNFLAYSMHEELHTDKD